MGERKDAALLSRARSGDPEARNDLVRRYWRAAYMYALHILRRHEDAEDIAQEALLSAIGHLGTFEERGSFGTWLNRIVFNQSIMLLRHKRSCALDAACPLDEQMQKRLCQVHASPERQIMEAEQCRLVNAAVKTLPENYGIPLWLYTYEEESVSDIAQHLQLSLNGVKIRLHRARKLLSKKTARASRRMSARTTAAA